MRLSIITVNLNNREGMLKTLNSIISQTSDEYEWIVIDGGSTDGSKELIEENSKYIKHWVSETDHGIYEAMNKGVALSCGDYLQFLNSGDSLADKDAITDFISQDFKEDVIYGNAYIVDGQGNGIGYFNAPEEIRMSYFFNHALNHQATFFSKRCFDNYRYNEQNKIASDVELFMYLLYHHYSFRKYGRIIVKYDNTGISNNINEDEFQGIVQRVMPPGIRSDYKEFITFRDVDIAIMIKQIIKSNRLIRHLTRIILYPIYWLSKIL